MIVLQGKEYKSIKKMAQQLATNQVKMSTIMSRYNRGERDLKALTRPIDKSHLKGTSLNVNLKYKGKIYTSLASFARACKMPYGTIKARYRKSHDIEYLIAPIKKSSQYIKAEQQKVVAYNNEMVHKRNLLTITDVANATNYDNNVIANGLSSLTSHKKSNTNLGFDESDIVRLRFTEDERKHAPSPKLLVKWAFKSSAVQKIKNKVNQLVESNLILIPQLGGNYFYDPKTKSIWSNRKGGSSHALFQQIRVFNNDCGIRLNTPAGVVVRNIALNTIIDLIDNPQLTAKDLISAEQIRISTNMTLIQWNASKVYRGMRLHTRYDQNGNLIRGYSRVQAKEMRKKIKKYLTKHQPIRIAITIDGVKYKSIAQASEKIHIHRQRIANTINNLHKSEYTIDDFRKKSPGAIGKHVIVDGVYYASINQASEKLNISNVTISKYIKKLNKTEYSLSDFKPYSKRKKG